MENGICFLAAGKGVIPSLTIALYSLSKYYDGKICLFVKDLPDDFIKELQKNKNIIIDDKSVPLIEPLVANASSKFGVRCWCMKPLLQKLSPFDITVFYDADVVFIQKFDMEIFRLAQHHEIVCPTDMRLNSKRIRVGKELSDILHCKAFELHAEGGCVASLRTSNHLFSWFSATLMLSRFVGRRRKPIDEHALSYTISNCGGRYIDYKWALGLHCLDKNGVSPKNTIAVHCSMKRYSESAKYKQAMAQALKINYLNINNPDYSGLDEEFDKLIKKEK
jgi:hypothetical protein